MSKKYYYFVEGECEETLINLLKIVPQNILVPGRVNVFNVIQKRLSNQRIMVLEKDAVIVFVYDIDVHETKTSEYNINKLTSYGYKNIIHIQSINNFEDEIVYSSSLKDINNMFNTKDIKQFKNKFISHKDLNNKLKEIDFDYEKLWSRENKNKPFSKYSNIKFNKLIKIKK